MLSAQLIASVPNAGPLIGSLGGASIFAAPDVASSGGYDLWTSDGTAAGTKKFVFIPDTASIALLPPAPGFGISAAPSAFLLFNVYRGQNKPDELFRTDGTSAGTFALGHFSGLNVNDNNSGGYDLAYVDAKAYFVDAGDSLPGGVQGVNRGMWQSDGTVNGTRLATQRVDAIEAVSGHQIIASGFSTPGNDALIAYNTVTGQKTQLTTAPGGSLIKLGNAYLTDLHTATSSLLFTTDGTAANTKLLHTFNDATSQGRDFLQDAVALGGKLFFPAYDAPTGEELWSTDGTPAGTRIVRDIAPGAADSTPTALTPLNGKLVFAATDSAGGTEPWITDGTSSGTVRIKDIVPGSSSSLAGADIIGAVGNSALLEVQNIGGGIELWRTDGSSSGTSQVHVFGSDVDAAFYDIGAAPHGLVFTVDAGGATQVWASDGTSAHTTLLRTFAADDSAYANSSYPPNGLAHFDSNAGTWESDGTAAGTVLLTDPATGIHPLVQGYITQIDTSFQFGDSSGIWTVGQRVNLRADDATASENTTDTARITLTRTQVTSTPLIVRLVFSGTAINGVDTDLVPTTVTIPANAASVSITITAKSDATVEGPETLIVGLASDPAYAVGAPLPVAIAITNNGIAKPAPRIDSIGFSGEVFSKLTINGAFKVGVATTVRLFDGSGYSVDLTARSVTATQILSTVPPYFSAKTGRLSSGAMKVQVLQTIASGAATGSARFAIPAAASVVPSNVTSINVLPVLSLPPNQKAGTVITAYLRGALKASQDTLAYIQTSGIDTPALTHSVQDQISLLQQQIQIFQTAMQSPGGTANFPGSSGQVTKLDQQALQELDRLTIQVARITSTLLPANNPAAQFSGAAVNAASSAAVIEAAATSYVRNSYAQDVTDSSELVEQMGDVVSRAAEAGKSIIPELKGVGPGIELGIIAGNALTGAAVSYSSITERNAIERGRLERAAHDFYIKAALGVGNVALGAAGLLLVDYYPLYAAILGLYKLQGDKEVGAFDGIPKLDLVAEKPQTIESAGNNGLFVVGVLRGSATGFVVRFDIGGTAINGEDYTTIPKQTSFQAVDGATLEVPVYPRMDGRVDGIETVVLTIKNAPTDPYLVIGSDSAIVSIAELPTITVTSSPSEIVSGDDGTFTFTRSGPSWGTVKAKYSIGGTASNPGDYIPSIVPLNGSITFGPNELTKTVSIYSRSNPPAGAPKTLTLTVKNDPTQVRVGTPASATITFISAATVSIAATDPSTKEGDLEGYPSADAAVFRIMRTGLVVKPLIVMLAQDTSVANSVNSKDIFGKLPASVTIPAGQSYVDVTVEAVGDTLVEPTETLKLDIVSGAGYAIDQKKNSASAFFIDNVNGRISGNWSGDYNLQGPLQGYAGDLAGYKATLTGKGKIAIHIVSADYVTNGISKSSLEGTIKTVAGLSSSAGSNPDYKIKNLQADSSVAPGTFGLVGPSIVNPKPYVPGDTFTAFFTFDLAYDQYFSSGGFVSHETDSQEVAATFTVIGDSLLVTLLGPFSGSFTLKRQPFTLT